MIDRIISDCEKALDHDLYFAALNLALTLPDICAKAKYPNEKNNKKRYVDWYEEYLGQYEKGPRFSDEKDDMPYQSGEVIYSLRCSMLHQGTPNVEESKCNITKFVLIVEKKKPHNIYSCDVRQMSDNERELSLNVRTLCWKICAVAKNYYRENKELFDFFNYHLLNWDEEMERLHRYDESLEKWKKGVKDDQT